MAHPKNQTSMETILTFENRDVSQWSAVWSTANIPSAAGGVMSGDVSRQAAGRLRLRLASLSLGAFLAMHCKVAAAALTGGYFIFVLFLIVSVAALANPLRHFEVYLGQWSISGPGRAFHIIPMLDGIGIAFCINSLVRAITCCSVAAISAVYLLQSVSDEELPFTYCRNFQLKTYKPILQEIKPKRLFDPTSYMINRLILKDWRKYHLSKLHNTPSATSVEITDHAWRRSGAKHEVYPKIEVCNETYDGRYPALYNTPAYNYFYVEVVHLRQDHDLLSFNSKLMWNIVGAWLIIWIILVGERIAYGRLVWNKTNRWVILVPWIWAITLLAVAIGHYSLMQYKIKHAFKVGFGAKDTLGAIADALDVAIYIHAAGLGTELIHGKGLNHFASGHIDPFLNHDNVWHSVLILLVAALHSGGASACAFVDYLQFEVDQEIKDMRESTLWIIPMYSKCVSQGNYSHLASTLLFGGLTLSYMAVAFTLIKTVLHTIFEYKITLVYLEQGVVGFLIIFCMVCSLFFASNGGIVFLESVESLMTTIATPIIVLLELLALLYVYRSRDFQSDMDLATEDNACGSRLATQWQIIPFVTLETAKARKAWKELKENFVSQDLRMSMLVLKIYMLVNTELPANTVLLALLPLLSVVAAVPLRAAHNIVLFLRHKRRDQANQ